MTFFDGFTLDRIGGLRVRHGGSGPPVLLLHGHPRTHTTWHRVAPLLAPQHTVVCPDLPGYGRSHKAAPSTKRAMAAECLELMRSLGHERFAVVGHDRGSYVAFRLAMDHPGVVTHLAVLDCVPIGEALRRCDVRFATEWWHWFFLPTPQAPRVINADPDAWYRTHDQRAAMGEENWRDFMEAVHDPATVEAMCADYAAGPATDRHDDDADRAQGRRLPMPTLVAWSRRDDLERLYGDLVALWREWADDVTGVAVDSGHHMAEEAPAALAAAVLELLRRPCCPG